MKTVIEQLRDEIESAPEWDDWDLGYKAGLQKAIEILRNEEFDKILEAVKEVYNRNNDND